MRRLVLIEIILLMVLLCTSCAVPIAQPEATTELLVETTPVDTVAERLPRYIATFTNLDIECYYTLEELPCDSGRAWLMCYIDVGNRQMDYILIEWDGEFFSRCNIHAGYQR